MNSPLIPELSLYQLTQEILPPPLPLTVSMRTFKSLVGAWLECLNEQQIEATIWLKMPDNDRWLAVNESYQQAGLARQIYSCRIEQGMTISLPTSSPSLEAAITPIFLEASTQLRQEYFLLVLSPQFCGLLLAQQPTSPPTTFQTQVSSLQLIYSFEPAVIERVLQGIQQAIVITDTTPEELLTASVPLFPWPASPEVTILNALLRQQIEWGERQQPLENSPFSLEFLSNLVQELSLPLTNMKTALRLLDSMQHKREQRRRYLDLLQQECNRQNSLFTGLQQLVQLNQVAETFEPALKLEDIIPATVSTYQPLAEEKGIVLGYTVPPGLPAVACPGNWLQQILRQLLHNSLKFTPSQGKIDVRVALEGQGIELTVSNTGIGIDSSDIPHLFSKFYRGRNAVGDLAGAGLGLAIVKELVERCGGSVEVTSRRGGRTIFKVTLPVG